MWPLLMARSALEQIPITYRTILREAYDAARPTSSGCRDWLGTVRRILGCRIYGFCFCAPPCSSQENSSCLDQDLADCSLRCFRRNAVRATDLRFRLSMESYRQQYGLPPLSIEGLQLHTRRESRSSVKSKRPSALDRKELTSNERVSLESDHKSHGTPLEVPASTAP
jgi:hypothetical protein